MILFLLAGILIVSVLWELYYKHNWIKGVSVKMWFDTEALYAGERTKIFEVIENRKRMPVFVLEVGFHTKKELDFADAQNTNVSDYIYKRDVFSVLGSQKITRQIPVSCKKRGKYEVSDADLTTYTLFFRTHYSVGLETDAQIYVYPKMTDVSEIMTVCERMLGTLQCAKRLYEDPFAFRTIRGYTTDDPMKAINWKASAKTGALMVNTFDSVQSQKAMIFLDVEDIGVLKREALVEESIAIAATMARKLLRQGIETGLAFNGNRDMVFFPENQKSRLIGIERMLAEFNENDEVIPFEDMISAIFENNAKKPTFSEDTFFVFITKNLTDNLYRNIVKTAEGYFGMIVYLVGRGEDKGFDINDFNTNNFKESKDITVLVKEVDAI